MSCPYWGKGLGHQFRRYDGPNSTPRCRCGATPDQASLFDGQTVVETGPGDLRRRLRDLTDAQRSVLVLLAGSWPAGRTDEELVIGYSSAILQSESGIRTRRSELVKLGLVVDSGDRRETQYGNPSTVWRVGDEAADILSLDRTKGNRR